ncbi:DegT/DnrJ/EryC1/StrS family aminotransferase [Bacillus cereus]
MKKHWNANATIILTHLYGCQVNTEIIDWARENNIYIIDDAAQAMFSYQNGKPAL